MSINATQCQHRNLVEDQKVWCTQSISIDDEGGIDYHDSELFDSEADGWRCEDCGEKWTEYESFTAAVITARSHP